MIGKTKIIPILSVVLLVLGSLSIAYGYSPDLRRDLKAGIGVKRFSTQEVKAQVVEMPTTIDAFWLHRMDGSTVTDHSILRSLRLDDKPSHHVDEGAPTKKEKQNRFYYVGVNTNPDWGTYVYGRTKTSGKIKFGGWPTGLKINHIQGAGLMYHIRGYDQSYNYPPRVFGVNLSKVDEYTVKCKGDGWPIDVKRAKGPYGKSGFLLEEIGDSIISYEWSFDDGATASGKEVTHTFSTSGKHTVKFTVTDEGGKTATVTKTINLAAPTHYVTVDVQPRSPGSSSGEVKVSDEVNRTITHVQGFNLKEGETITLKAIPHDGYFDRGSSFSGWSGSISRTENPTSVTVTGDMEIHANFAEENPEIYPVSVGVDGGGTVTVDVSGGITGTRSSDFSFEVEAGTPVTLTAEPDPGYDFSSWSGDYLSREKTINITVDESTSVTANFVEEGKPKPPTYKLDVDSTSGGYVEPGDGTYESGEEVTVMAVSDPGYTFDHWEGDLSGTADTKFVTMDSDKYVKAVFVKDVDYYSVQVNADPSGGGHVSLSPSQRTYRSGTSVTATAVPAPGYAFTHWSGDVSGDSTSVTFDVTGNMTVTANFKKKEEKPEYTLTTEVASGKGSVSPRSKTVPAGEKVRIVATPASGYVFDHWGGDASGNGNPITVTMNSDRTVKAYFSSGEYELTMLKSPAGGGSVSVVGVTGQAVQKSFPGGATVTVRATPTGGYLFTGWKGPVKTDPGERTAKVYMDSDKTITATFGKVEPEEGVNYVAMGAGILMVLLALGLLATYVRGRRW